MLSKTFKKVLIGAAAVLTVGGATLTAATADAHPWGGGWHGGGFGGPAAVFGAGVLGVAIGESLAHPYAGPPPAYYAGPGYWADYDGCRAYWRWDAHWGRYVRVERCY